MRPGRHGPGGVRLNFVRRIEAGSFPDQFAPFVGVVEGCDLKGRFEGQGCLCLRMKHLEKLRFAESFLPLGRSNREIVKCYFFLSRQSV